MRFFNFGLLFVSICLFYSNSLRAESEHGDSGDLYEFEASGPSEMENYDFDAGVDPAVVNLFEDYAFSTREKAAKTEGLPQLLEESTLDAAEKEDFRQRIQTAVSIQFGSDKLEKRTLSGNAVAKETASAAQTAPVQTAAQTQPMVSLPSIVLNNVVNAPMVSADSGSKAVTQEAMAQRRVSTNRPVIVLVNGTRMLYSGGKLQPLQSDQKKSLAEKLAQWFSRLKGEKRVPTSVLHGQKSAKRIPVDGGSEDIRLGQRGVMIEPQSIPEAPLYVEMAETESMSLPLILIFIGGMVTTGLVFLAIRMKDRWWKKAAAPVVTVAPKEKSRRHKNPIRIPEERTLDGTFMFPKK